MDRSAAEGKGHLYRVDEKLQFKPMASGYTIPNGMAWSKDGASFFIADSGKRQIIRYAFDAEKGEIANPEVLVETSVAMGLPDGMCIDNQDNLWVAFWTGGCVAVFDSHTGQMLKSISVPCMVPTSCCIGGANGSSLIVTSSRKYDTQDNIERFPHAGYLFLLDVDVKAPDANFFNDKPM
jgi:sugar lactone lactonase YvrE